MYRPKHCSHVARSGISFLAPDRSSARMTTMWPSSALGKGRARPLAGGSSEKSTYYPERIRSTIFFGREGRPAPTDTSLGGLAAAVGSASPTPLRAFAVSTLSVASPASCLDLASCCKPFSSLSGGILPSWTPMHGGENGY